MKKELNTNTMTKRQRALYYHRVCLDDGPSYGHRGSFRTCPQENCAAEHPKRRGEPDAFAVPVSLQLIKDCLAFVNRAALPLGGNTLAQCRHLRRTLRRVKGLAEAMKVN